MSGHHLRLDWDDHGNELIGLTRSLYGESELSDVSLTCHGGVTFNAHRMVLAGASNYFRNTFKGISSMKHPVIFLKDVMPKEMEYFLQFIYYGEVNVAADELQNLITVAKHLGIKGLDGINNEKEPDAISTKDNNNPPQLKDLKRKAAIQSCSGQSMSETKRTKIKEETLDMDEEILFQGDDDPLDEVETEGIDEASEPDIKPRYYHPLLAPRPKKTLPEKTYNDAGGDNIIEILESNRGNMKIALNGFMYVRKCKGSPGDSITLWKCSRKNCFGTAETGMLMRKRDRNVTEMSHFDIHCLNGQMKQEHSHPPDNLDVERAKILNKINKMATSEIYMNATLTPPPPMTAEEKKRNNTSNKIDELLATCSPELLKRLPDRKSMMRSYLRSRKKALVQLCGTDEPEEYESAGQEPE